MTRSPETNFSAIENDAWSNVHNHAYGAARVAFNRLIELYPERSEGWRGLSHLCISCGALGAALALIDKVCAEFASPSAALLQKAGVFVQLHRHEDAAEIIQQVLASEPHLLDARIAEANLLGARGAIIPALARWEAILEQEPGAMAAIAGKAMAMLALGRDAEVTALLARIPDRGAALHFGAALALRQRRFDEMLEHATKLVEQFPADLAAWQLKITAVALCSKAGAWSLIKELQERFPEAPAGYLAAAGTYEYLGLWEDAEREWRNIEERLPLFMRSLTARAATLTVRGRFSEAEALLRHYTERYPDDALGCVRLGELLVRQERFGDAIALYDGALTRFRNHAELFAGRAWAMVFTGRLSQAIEGIERCLETAPDAVPPLHARFLLARDTCHVSDAVHWARCLYTSVAATAEVCAWWVEALYAAGDAENALRVARDHLTADPLAQNVALSLLRILGQRKAWNEVIEEVDRILDEHPSMLRVVAFKAIALVHLEQAQKAHDFLSDRRATSRRHVLITGTGRSGTTVLIQLLTHLGLDTGYTVESCHRLVTASCNAGLEQNIFAESAPYVVKSPDASDYIAEIVAAPDFVLDHVFIPLRDVDDAAASRIAVQTASAYGNTLVVPGGLVKSLDPRDAKPLLLERLFRLVSYLEMFEIPCTFIQFPRFVRDAQYLYRKLAPLIGATIEYERFKAAYDAVMDANKVHDFS